MQRHRERKYPGLCWRMLVKRLETASYMETVLFCIRLCFKERVWTPKMMSFREQLGQSKNNNRI